MVINNKKNYLGIFLFLATIIYILLVDSIVIVNYVSEKIMTSHLAREFEEDSTFYNSLKFLDINKNEQQGIMLEIIKNSEWDLDIDTTKNNTLNVYHVIFSASVPNFSAIMSKNYPQLFTYVNKNYLTTQLNNQTESEYFNEIVNTVYSELNNSSIFYSFSIPITLTKENGTWQILNTDDLENQLLGNIYSYQNSDVQFLSFNSLIFPDDRESVRTTETSINHLFNNTSPQENSTYSSIDVPISIGDTVTFHGKLQETSPTIEMNLTIINKSQSSDGKTTIKISGQIVDGEETVIDPFMFLGYNNSYDNYQKCISNDTISLNTEITEFDLIKMFVAHS